MSRLSYSPALLPGLALATLVAGFGFAGCSSTPASAPADFNLTRSPSSSLFMPQASVRGQLDPLWPNDDGRFWNYHVVEAVSAVPLEVYLPPAQVPPAPSVWELAALLRSESRSGNGGAPETGVETGTYTLLFQGRLTTESGAEGQNLTETLVSDASRGVPQARNLGAGGTGSAFWSHLAAARPDLAPAVRKRLGLSANATLALDSGPLLLHGGAWEKTPAHIASYGDLNRDISWLYLVANVLPNSTFDLQLVPDLAEDVWLHALVLPRRFTFSPRGAAGAVDVLYLIDYGVEQLTSPTGEGLGLIRSIEYGTVTYAPGVGPVAGFERAVFPGYFDSSPEIQGMKIETWSTLSSTGSGTLTVDTGR